MGCFLRQKIQFVIWLRLDVIYALLNSVNIIEYSYLEIA